MSSWTIWQRTENYPFAKENPQQHPHWQRHWDNRKPRLDEAQHRKLTQRINNQQCPLCPDITGEFPNNDAEYDKYYAGAFGTGTPFEGGYSDQLPAGGKTGRFKASWASSIYGYNSDVLVDALYVLIIIKT